MTSTHFDLDDTDDLVIPRSADCSDETWAEIGRLADQRFKALTAKATCPSWCVTEHDVTDPENTIFHRDQEVNVANYKIQLDLDPPTIEGFVPVAAGAPHANGRSNNDGNGQEDGWASERPERQAEKHSEAPARPDVPFRDGWWN